LTDGTKLSERVEHVRGTPDNPMTQGEVVAKARELMTGVLGAATCSKLIDRVLALDAVKDIRELRPLLHGPDQAKRSSVANVALNQQG
ncbi:MAG: hypothetical protein DMG84_24185, partial [Acidobacteria bacterium]